MQNPNHPERKSRHLDAFALTLAPVPAVFASGLAIAALAFAAAGPVAAEPPRPHTPPPAVEPLPDYTSPPAADTPSPHGGTLPPAEASPNPDDNRTDELAPVGTESPTENAGEAPSDPAASEEAADESGAEDDEASAQEPESALPLTELRSFAEIFGRIKSDYVERVDDEALLGAAIRGMLAGLDPHSTYLDAEEYEDLQVGTKGEFGGLGIEVGMEDGFVKVISPIDDTPAQRAGVQAGDLIIRIDDKPVKGMNLSDAVKLMRGEPGTPIELTIMRDGEDKPLKIAIVRDIIQVASVKSRELEPGYVYVRIANFQSRTTEDLRRQIEEFKLKKRGSEQDQQPAGATASSEASDGGPSSTHQETPGDDAEVPTGESTANSAIKGLVLDLRNNPGGVLNSAVGVSDAFLRGGLIVYTQGRLDEARMEFKAGPDDIIADAPLVVLVNGGSASASEIVAGALQDQGRAIVMGSDTFGKGSVQTIVPVDGTTALKLTTARYYTPSGRSIQAHGIEPDIRLERGSLTLADKPTVEPLKEANLMRHLEEEVPTLDSTEDDATEKPLAAQDYQLGEALNVLKALSIARTRTVAAPEILEPPVRE